MSSSYRPRQWYQLKSHPPDRLLKDHLQRVAKATQRTIGNLLLDNVSTTIHHKDLIRTAYTIGACHDVGKGTQFFQTYLLDDKAKIDPYLKSHSMISSLYCSWIILNDSTISTTNKEFLALAASIVIQGHHGSLKSRTKYLSNLDYFYENNIFSMQIESFKVHEEEMETITTLDLGLKSFREFCRLWQEHLFNFQQKIVLLQNFIFEDKMEPYFTINMLFSALLDADNFDAAELERPSRPPLDLNIVKSYVRKNLVQTTEIDRLRKVLFEYVDKQNQFDLANNNHKIFTLTAPTGLGKTFTSINFALNLRKRIELARGNKPRIIYVAPFLSILDQNMEALQKVFLGDKENNNRINKMTNTSLLLMHHHLSPINYHDDTFKKEGYTTSQSEFLIHGWNAEVIVTTFIQFFNMVFGRYTTQLRRLDNAIGSIVILDEVQSIPFELWGIVREGLLYLSKNFSFTIILMTATQPMIFEKEEAVEVAETNKEIKAMPQRVSFVIENEHRITLNEFCNEMNDLISKHQEKNILIELNTIFTARECFDNIHSDNHDIRFLSSQVIPKHRRPRINDLKKKLNDGDNKKVILVTTQVVEAGVDLDFDIAVRDIGPIDSIVQTAGRCNREGRKKTEDSLFYVYRIRDDRIKNIEVEYAKSVYGPVAIEIANSMLNTMTTDFDLNKLVYNYYNAIKERKSKQKSNEIYDFVSDLNYEEVANKFLLIDKNEYKLPVFVEFDNEAARIWNSFLNLSANNNDKDKDKNKNKRKKTAESLELRNQMGQYLIDVSEKEINAANLQEINGIYRIDNRDIARFYDEEKGFMACQDC
jgi:CRISPR-associated endonuclease/helicase Cas3